MESGHVGNQVRPIDADTAVQAGELLGRTFAAESWTRELLPDPAERVRFCTVLYTANVRWSLDRGSVWAVESEPGTLGGVLTLIDEPSPSMTSTDASAYGYDQVDTEWPGILADFDALEGPAMDSLTASPGPWTYVNVLGVDPAWQGRGLGTQLMHHAMARADSAGLRMGLITDNSRNVRFYERFGFHVIVDGHEGKSLRLWAMARRSG